jgi:hypothetical protein
MDPRPNSPPPEAYRGPLQKSANDWGYYYAYWGLGGTQSPKPDHAKLASMANYWSSQGNFGFQFYGEKIPAATDRVSIEGDMMLLFRIPGMDPTAAVGVMVRMYDGSRTRYAEAFLSLSNITTTQMDTCILPGLGVMKTVSCPAGLSILPVRMQAPLSFTPESRGTLYYLLKLMIVYKNPHITLVTSNGSGFVWAWKDGIPIVIVMSTPNLAKDFFNK